MSKTKNIMKHLYPTSIQKRWYQSNIGINLMTNFQPSTELSYNKSASCGKWNFAQAKRVVADLEGIPGSSIREGKAAAPPTIPAPNVRRRILPPPLVSSVRLFASLSPSLNLDIENGGHKPTWNNNETKDNSKRLMYSFKIPNIVWRNINPRTILACSYLLCILFLYWMIWNLHWTLSNILCVQVSRRITLEDNNLSLSTRNLHHNLYSRWTNLNCSMCGRPKLGSKTLQG